MIAALFVQTNGAYYGLPDVDPWDEARDARKYAGPHPVVAHPPCSRWCRLAGLVEKVHGYKRGEDEGCFASALASVRRWGGVLEHPAYSSAWSHFLLPEPPASGGWVRGICGGWAAHVEQWHYGHRAKKATWLYAFGSFPPPITWGSTPDNAVTAYVTDGGGDVKRRRARGPTALVTDDALNRRKRPVALVSWCGNHIASGEKRPRLGKKEASATPPAFRDLLLSIARSAGGAHDAE